MPSLPHLKAERKAALTFKGRMDEVKEQIKEKEKAMRPLKQKLECVSPLHPLLSPQFALRCRRTLTRPVCREYEAKIKQFDVKKQKGAEELVRLDRQRKNIGTYAGPARN